MGGAEGTEVLNNRQGAANLTKAFEQVYRSKEVVSGYVVCAWPVLLPYAAVSCNRVHHPA